MSTPSARLTVENAQAFFDVLSALKTGSKKVVCLIFNPGSFGVRWEDDSGCMQSSLRISSEAFCEFHCLDDEVILGIQYNALLQTLAAFSLSCHGPLELKYPGLNNDLLLEMRDSENPEAMSLYARIDTLNVQVPVGIDCQDPHSYFLVQGAIMKEVVFDLEWPQSGVAKITMKKDPKSIALQADSGTTNLQIDLRIEELSDFSCHSDSLSHNYNLKHLKLAFANIERQKTPGVGTISKVVIDAQGVLKITHFFNLAFDDVRHNASDAHRQSNQQVPPGSRRWKPKVQFVILPLENCRDPFSEDDD